ncbi:MAG TPA: disulfide bond formation protein B [Macromonas sp.]|nr:disulfide bond formation protein B [Macromonas sp.]
MSDWWLCFQRHPRRILLAVTALCAGLLVFGLYLQHSVGLDPCPMCIVQRYALVLVALLAVVGAALPMGKARVGIVLGLLGVALFGAFVAARQSWLQWFPPEVFACGRDFYGMVENFPLKRAIPMIFRGSGDCSAVDWTFLGLSIANWSFLNFVLLAGVAAGLLVWRKR